MSELKALWCFQYEDTPSNSGNGGRLVCVVGLLRVWIAITWVISDRGRPFARFDGYASANGRPFDSNSITLGLHYEASLFLQIVARLRVSTTFA